MQDKIYMGQ